MTAEIKINGLFVHDYMMLGGFKGMQGGDVSLYFRTNGLKIEYVRLVIHTVSVRLICMSQIKSRVCLNCYFEN